MRRASSRRSTRCEQAPQPSADRPSPSAASRQADVADARSSPTPLTHREIETLGLLTHGLSNKEIAGVMWLSDRTVERHITSLYRKIGRGTSQ